MPSIESKGTQDVQIYSEMAKISQHMVKIHGTSGVGTDL
jgi:hypothetical protein